MATSGSQNFSQNRDAIINDAYQLLGVYGIGRTISSEDVTVASNALNRMVKAWATKGLHLWAKEEGVLFITPNTASYTLGNASGDAHATKLDDLVLTQLNGALAASATSVTVDDTTGMTASDNIGIVLADKTIHWTTIVSVDSSTTLTLTTGVPGAANDDALVYTYTDKIYKPLRILDARRRTGVDSGATSTEFDLPLTEVSYQDYFELPTKAVNSIPNQFHYNPKLTSGKIYLYPRPSDGAERIHFSYERVLEDLDSASDDFDFPAEWLEPIVWQLAVRLGPMCGRTQKAQQLLPIAGQMLDNLLDWDAEVSEWSIMPDLDYNN